MYLNWYHNSVALYELHSIFCGNYFDLKIQFTKKWNLFEHKNNILCVVPNEDNEVTPMLCVFNESASLPGLQILLYECLIVCDNKIGFRNFCNTKLIPSKSGIRRWKTFTLRYVGRSLWKWSTPDKTSGTGSSCLPWAFSDWLSQKQFPVLCSCPLASSLNVRLTGCYTHTHTPTWKTQNRDTYLYK